MDGIQTPCVADTCRAVFDRRFLVEEGFETARGEIEALLDRARGLEPRVHFALRDLMVVHPTRTPDDSPVIAALQGGIWFAPKLWAPKVSRLDPLKGLKRMFGAHGAALMKP